MIFVVDGYNAIRRVETLRRMEAENGLEAGRRALVATLLASGVLRSHRATVVFDGDRDAPPSTPSPHPRLSIRYSVPPENADAAILAGLKRHRSAKDVTVVTADGDLAFEARRLGASVVSPEAWSALRPRRSRTPARARDRDSAEKPTASPADVSYWLDVFGEK